VRRQCAHGMMHIDRAASDHPFDDRQCGRVRAIISIRSFMLKRLVRACSPPAGLARRQRALHRRGRILPRQPLPRAQGAAAHCGLDSQDGRRGTAVGTRHLCPASPSRGGSVWASGRKHTPSRVPQRWGTTSCREAAPLTPPTCTCTPAPIPRSRCGGACVRGCGMQQGMSLLVRSAVSLAFSERRGGGGRFEQVSEQRRTMLKGQRASGGGGEGGGTGLFALLDHGARSSCRCLYAH
jgi:hypothetical protein